MENLCKTSGRNESGAGKKILLGIGILIACVLLAAGYFLFARPALLKLRYKLEYEDVILHQAEESNLDPALVASVIFCESSYDKNAKSPVGAQWAHAAYASYGSGGGWVAGASRLFGKHAYGSGSEYPTWMSISCLSDRRDGIGTGGGLRL